MFFVSSCVRERDTDLSVASQAAMMQLYFMDAIDICNDAATKNTGDFLSNYNPTGNCASIIHDNVSTPRTITINFGPTACTQLDGRTRSGIVKITYNGNYNDDGETHQIEFIDYNINGHQVTSTNFSVHNRGVNSSAQSQYDIIIDGGKVVIADTAGEMYWNANQLRTFKEGDGNTQYKDDIYAYSGKASGKNPQGLSFAVGFRSPLLKTAMMQCRHFVGGIMDVQLQGHTLRSIDFGNVNCENNATVTLDNKTFDLILP